MDHSHHQMDSEVNLTSMERLKDAFSQYGFMPHGHCYLWKPLLVSIHVISDFLIGTAYLGISLTLYWLIKKIKLPFNRVVLCFGVFIGACGLTHFMEIWNLWQADYWWSAWVKVVTAVASVGTGVYLFKLRHSIIQVAEATKLAEKRHLDLQVLTEELEQRVKERTEQLTNAIKARDQFLSLASHELKTPLTTIKLRAQMSDRILKRSGTPISDETARLIEEVDHQTNRLTRIVDDMLDVSRIQSGKFEFKLESVDISALVKSIMDRFQLQFIEVGISTSVILSSPVIVTVDKYRIEQVINNIITNAIKYAPRSPFRIGIESLQGEVRITLEDEGQGIDKAKLEKIFQRFERATSGNEVSGLGLGLFISREIIEAHGGRIWAESELGKGTKFIILLPSHP